MASKTINAVLLTRSDTEVNFQTNNPILANGEMAISTDKGNKFKVGDGVPDDHIVFNLVAIL